MNFQEYQSQSQYFRKPSADLVYAVMGLAEEAGEVAGKFAKWRRDETDSEKLREDVKKELGDVFWMIASIATDLHLPLEEIASGNIEKLSARLSKGTISGQGDDR